MDSDGITQLSADKNVEQLSEEELHCVLKQLIDHKLPEKEKCPLVRRLNAEEALSSNNSSYKPLLLPGNSGDSLNRSPVKPRNRINKDNDFDSGSLSNHASTPHVRNEQMKCAQFCRDLRPKCDDSQNLPAPISNSNTEIVAANYLRSSGGSSRKPNRANSFTMPSQSDNSNKSDASVKILDHLTNGAEVTRDSLRFGDKQTLNGSSSLTNNHKSSSSSVNQPNSTSSQSYSNSSHYLSSDTNADHNHSSNKSSSHNFSSVHIAKISSLVEGFGSANSPRYYQDRRDLNRSNSQSLTVQEEDEERLEFGEMKNLHSNINYCYYNSASSQDQNNDNIDLNNKHNVDKTIEMPMLSRKSDDSSVSERNFQGGPLALANSSTGSASSNTRQKKKKRPQETVKFAEQIDGYVGYIQDVSYLDSFVNGNLNEYQKQKGKVQSKQTSDIKKRPKRTNGEILPRAQMEGDNRDLSNSKMPLSNSSSLSGDEMTADKTVNGMLVNSITSLEASSANGAKPKKNKSKNKQDKNNNKVNDAVLTNNGNNDTELSLNKLEASKQRTDGMDQEESKSNSSLDSTDTEDDEQIDSFPRSKKSNSLLSTKISLQEDDELRTVSDSEMADREKGFVTPKNKHFKKKKFPQNMRQYPTLESSMYKPKNGPHKHLPFNSNSNGVHNLGRGYESEREYSLNCLNPRTFASQSLSSSMLAINSRNSDKRSVGNLSSLSPPTNLDSNSLLSEPTNLFGDSDLGMPLPPCDIQESGPKMPSYADIAKSFHQTANIKNVTVSSTPKPSLNDNTSAAIEEFPQLNLQSPNDSRAHTLDTLQEFTTSSSNTTISKQSSSFKAESLTKEELNKKDFISSQNVSSTVITEEPEILNDSDSVIDETSISPENVTAAAAPPLEEVSKLSEDQPVVTFGDNTGDISTENERTAANCDQSIGSSSNKLVFGFFEDSEMSIIQEAACCPIEEFFCNSKDSDFIQSTLYENDSVNLNNSQTCKDEKEEKEEEEVSDLKNAVNLFDLEEKMLNMDECSKVSDKSATIYCSSPLPSINSSHNTSGDVSSCSSLATMDATNFVDETKPFVSCVDSLQNYKFIDNVDSNSFNYSNVIQYVAKAWKSCNSNLQGF